MNPWDTGNHAEVVGLPVTPEEAAAFTARGGLLLASGAAPARLHKRATVERGAWFVTWNLLGAAGDAVMSAYRNVPAKR